MQELSTVWWMCNEESQQIIWRWKWGQLHLCLILKVHCVRNLVEKHHKETVCMTLASCSCSWHSHGRLKTPRYFLCLETSCHYIQSTLVIHVHYRGTLYWRLWKNLCLQVVKMENSPRKCEIVNYAVHSDSLGVCKMQLSVKVINAVSKLSMKCVWKCSDCCFVYWWKWGQLHAHYDAKNPTNFVLL